MTTLPSSWAIEDTADFFGVTNYMVRQSRTLKKEKGILAKRNEKEWKSVPADDIKQVQDFYQSDEVSQMCPGKKDFVPVKIDGIKQHKHKRLLLCNLNELHSNFKQKFGQKISLPNFASYAPSGVLQ